MKFERLSFFDSLFFREMNYGICRQSDNLYKIR